MKTHTYVTQPTVRFKYDALMMFENTVPGAERVWSTFDSVNALMGAKLAAVDVQASEQDLNMDGKVDVIDIKAVARGLGDVHGVKAMFAFDYAIGGRVDLALNGMAYVSHISPLPGSGLYVDGYLKLEQRDAIQAGTTRLDYNRSVFPLRRTASWRATFERRRRCVCPSSSTTTTSETRRRTWTLRRRCGSRRTRAISPSTRA